jgi:nucleosome assembly protein 1-like 1
VSNATRQAPELRQWGKLCFNRTIFFHPTFFFLLVAQMSPNVPISQSGFTAPTPQNTPLTHAPIAAGLSRPTVPDISEDNEADDEITSPGANELQAGMLGMIQGKLAGLVGKSSGYIENLPDEVKLSVAALKGVQIKQNELQNKYKRECLELEKKVRSGSFSSTLSLMLFSVVPRAPKATVQPQTRHHHWL